MHTKSFSNEKIWSYKNDGIKNGEGQTWWLLPLILAHNWGQPSQHSEL